jgi:hypothetical protein
LTAERVSVGAHVSVVSSIPGKNRFFVYLGASSLRLMEQQREVKMTSNIAEEELPLDPESPVSAPPLPPVTSDPKPKKGVVRPSITWEPNTPPRD